MVTAEFFQQLSTPQLAQLAQSVTDMFTSRDFETQWTTSGRSESGPQKVFSEKLLEFRLNSSLSTMRMLLGYVWLVAMGDTQFHSFQTSFPRKTDAFARSVLERASELAKEWKTHLFAAQVDLTKTFDHIQQSFAYTALQKQKGYPSSCSR